ncbi:polysaccharide pyruvyl transferase family protein [Actinophytocola oryzae]|uniref:Polysaccharide pyruvyl transferase WcaK-like protein n=1 Tax=Actinophytocola oryzae TaxID=502181 RepID=A0A4R7VD40_9PSEU|nr:polysaccharide pyruvyl transferase family protein [Actinophytocola oryzae]TDV46889.1 polysaccharide pyruvyl transferase WcaK-like protein [Actinophytocola oryzae]
MKVGLFGLLGTGNLGNDGSLAAVLAHLRERHPQARIEVFCSGPEDVMARHGVPAVRMNWYRDEYATASRLSSIVRKGLGKLVDIVRTADWVRRQDVVVVPGMGVLETTLPLRPWGWPYSLFLLSFTGKLVRTKVVFLAVGAGTVADRANRTLLVGAARLAYYRSYRDEVSRDALSAMGLDTSHDPVHTDLAFALPNPTPPVDAGVVGVGVMDYHGSNTDRARAGRIHRDYVSRMTEFVRWLVEDGRVVRLFVGDHVDEGVAERIIAAVGSPAVSVVHTSSLDELLREMARVDAVVASRYHNVLAALKLGKPTVAVGYAAKSDALMAEMGLGEFCQSIRDLDVDRLVKQFTLAVERDAELRAVLARRNAEMTGRVERQLFELSAILRGERG